MRLKLLMQTSFFLLGSGYEHLVPSELSRAVDFKVHAIVPANRCVTSTSLGFRTRGLLSSTSGSGAAILSLLDDHELDI